MGLIRTDFNVQVPMRDGVTLSADVYRPRASSDAPCPAILLRTPYLNKTQAKAIETARYFAEHGYAVMWMDVRGRGDSDGTFSPYRHDGRDGYDSVEWLAAQPWCDGRVGTLGGSYLGHVQWLTALERPPHLTTMIVLVTPADPFVEWPTGVPSPMYLCWMHMVSGRVMRDVDAVDWRPLYEHLPLMTMDEQLGHVLPGWRDVLAHPQLDEFWEPLRYQNQFEKITVPVLHISGWYDDEQIATPFNFQGMVTRGATEFARQNQKLLMGPWGHAVNTVSKLGEVDFGPSALIDLKDYQRRWFDHWLKGQDSGLMREPPVRIFVMGENQWRDEQEWPLARTRWMRFYLHSAGHANSRFGDGTLSTQAPAAEPPDRYGYDPARPYPFITDATYAQVGGPDDYAALQRRDDVLVYVTAPLTDAVEITGPIRLELHAASSAVDTDFMAKLVDVHPNGFVQRLCDGMVRARYREGMHTASLIEPGRVYAYSIDMWHTCQVFLPGHRIGLEITSSAFPKYPRNLNTGEDLATGTRMAVADQTIFHDDQHPSVLVLPMIPKA